MTRRRQRTERRAPVTSHQWGRVDDDGTVYVRTADGERSVGQYPEGTPEEALAFFTERYDALAFEVELLEQRIRSGVMSPEEAAGVGAHRVRAGRDAHAVGDLDALTRGSTRSTPVIEQQREARKAEKAQRAAESRTAQGADRRRGREARRGQRLAQRRQPAARPARRVEGAPPPRPGLRRRAVAPLLQRPHDVHPAPQGALRRAARAARRRPGGQGAAGKRGRGAGRLHRVGPDRRSLPRPDAGVEGRRARPARRRRQAVAALPRRPGPFFGARDAANAAAGRGVRRQRGGQGAAAGRGRGAGAGAERAATSRPPRRPSATSRSAGTPPARSRATG